MITCKTAVLTLILALSAGHVEAQRNYNPYGNSQARSRSRLTTPYFSGRTGAYNHGYGGSSPYAVSPYLGYRAPVIATPALPPVSGPIERYSDVEYGEIVKMAIEAARANSPSGVSAPRTSIVDKTTVSLTGQAAYEPIATGVSDVLDRGILLLPTGEELRLRGVTMPSTTDRNEVSRIYAREGIQMLRNLTQGKEVYVVLDEPVRDSDGRLLGSVILADGTELNKKMLELGYGSLRPDDFAVGVDFSDLTISEQTAQQNRIGVWSKGY